MDDDAVEWDVAKAAANDANHGVSFETAKKVFNDPLAIERLDDREDYGEDRFNILGIVDDRVLFVAYTLRNGTIRIITLSIIDVRVNQIKVLPKVLIGSKRINRSLRSSPATSFNQLAPLVDESGIFPVNFAKRS